MVEKRDFLEVVKIPCPKTRFLVTLRSFFLSYSFFLEKGWLFPVNAFEKSISTNKLSFLAGLKKSYSIFRESTVFSLF